MMNKRLISRTCKILVDNKGTINPHYYVDKIFVQGSRKKFHSCCIIIDEYEVEERAVNRLGFEYTRKTKRKEIHSAICANEDEENYLLRCFNLGSSMDNTNNKVYVESISPNLSEQNNSIHPENSTITMKGDEDPRKNKYDRARNGEFKLSLPVAAPVYFYGIFNLGNGRKELRPVQMTTEQFLIMINKQYNELNLYSDSLKKEFQPNGAEVDYQVRDTRDLIDARNFAKAARRRAIKDKISETTYRPVEILRDTPGFIKERASNAFDNAYAHVANMKVKNLVIYAVVMALLSAGVGLVKKGYRNYQLEGAQNGFDMFTFDTKHATSKDEDLQIARDTYAPKVTELSNNAKTNLTQKEIEKTSKYMVDVASSGFDNNDSKNIIDLRKMLPARVTDVNLRKAQEALADKLQGKVESIIYRPSADKAIEFLDYTLPLALFSEEYVNHPFSTKYFGSSNGNCPTTEEIEIYSSLPDIVKKTVLAQIREVYKKFPGYKFVHPSATPDGKEEKYDVTSHLNNVDGAINFRLLVQASDYVVETGYRASGGK